jgi:predicted  nucleic acid-binding Zn-ribbon protein
MNPFAILLDLQAHDTAIDQRRHKRANLPERAEIVKLDRTLGALDTEAAELDATRGNLAREQRRYEDEATAIEEKAAAEDKRLYSGTVTSPKELQSLQEEISSLQRRQNMLEDQVLDLMEQGEPLDSQLGDLAKRRAELAARRADAAAVLAGDEAGLDAELAQLATERSALAEQVTSAILAEYEQLRTGLGGVAVARLEAGSCRGCHLHLAAIELDRIKKLPADAIVHCEECGRILVR